MGERVKVASLAEVPPGTGRQVQVSGRALAIYNLDGIMHAIDGNCRHLPLARGTLRRHDWSGIGSAGSAGSDQPSGHGGRRLDLRRAGLSTLRLCRTLVLADELQNPCS